MRPWATEADTDEAWTAASEAKEAYLVATEAYAEEIESWSVALGTQTAAVKEHMEAIEPVYRTADQALLECMDMECIHIFWRLTPTMALPSRLGVMNLLLGELPSSGNTSSS
jgi:hypothetical protein